MKPDTRPDPLEQMHQVMHLVRAKQRAALRDTTDLTPMEARVLGFFGRHPGATLKALAEHSGRDKAQLAKLIKNLREQGWLQAEDGADRRLQCLTLTPRGQALHTRMQALMKRIGTEAVQGLSATELQQLNDLLSRVRENVGPEA